MADNPVPLLIVSDAPSATSGLGRITRDLASRIHCGLPEFRVACAGYGGIGNCQFGFPEYHLHSIENWVLPELPAIVENFAGDQECIVWFIWDTSRVEWFAQPEFCPHLQLQAWLKTAKIRKWIYPAVDAEGPHGKLSARLSRTLKGFARVLNYSQFSARVTGYPDWLPHGIDTWVFKPYPRNPARELFRASGFRNLEAKDFLVNIVATNQVRKDWALGIATCRQILDRGYPLKVWCHTDTIIRAWDISLLLHDYGLTEHACLSTNGLTDERMAEFYSASNCSLSIGNGEGFGFSAAESLACQVPVVAGNYAGSTEVVPKEFLVEPIAWRYEGAYGSKRAVYDPEDWASKATWASRQACSLKAALDWNGSELWPRWKSWLLQGLE